jgi:hypothetical protein
MMEVAESRRVILKRHCSRENADILKHWRKYRAPWRAAERFRPGLANFALHQRRSARIWNERQNVVLD